MPELTIEHIRTCKQNLYYSVVIEGSKGNKYDVIYGESVNGPYQYNWQCSCADYLYRHNNNCKHIQQAKRMKCEWNVEAFMGCHAEANIDNTCPKCGGETSVIRVGV